MGTVVTLFRGIAEAAWGLLLTGAALYLPLLGYYGAACPYEGVSWAFALLILFPLAIPPLGLLWLVVGIAGGLLGQPFHRGTRFWSFAKWLLLAAVVGSGAAWAFARATDATARCNFGF